MSAELLLVNPRRRKRRKGRMPPALARYWATHRRKLRNPKRRKSRRRHAKRRHAVSGYMVGRAPIRRRKLNPRRRRRSAIAVSHRRSRRRHRNPRFGLPSVKGIVSSTLMPAAIGAGGALVLDVAYGYAQPYLPEALKGKWASLGVKLIGALALGYGASKFLGRERGRIASLGAVTVVAYGSIKSALKEQFPTIPGLSGYADFVDYSVNRNMGAYLPQATGVGELGFYSPAATMAPNNSGVGAYMPPGGLHGVDGYNWQNDGM